MTKMAGNVIENPFPEGINGLKCATNGKLYVINEILNFYQRKLSILTIDQALLLSHHLFEKELLEEAKQILKSLWDWRKCEPSSDNIYIIRNLAIRRNAKGAKSAIAKDIIKFLQVEGVNLGISFLTMNCEIIPSKILESEAMRDIYVALHQTETENKTIMDILEEKSVEIESYKNMVTSLQQQVKDGFEKITKLFSERPQFINASNASAQSPIEVINASNASGDNSINPTVVNVSIPEQQIGNDSIVNPGIGAAAVVVPSDPHTPTPTPQQVARPMSPLPPPTRREEGSELGISGETVSLEEGEIPDSDDDGLETISEASFSSAVDNNPWMVVGNSRRNRTWPPPPPPSPPPPPQPRTSGNIHTRRNGNDSSFSRSYYLRDKQQRNVVLDEGSNSIPFTAVREIHKYELFVTNVSKGTDVNIIKRHVCNMMGTTDVSIKIVSKENAKCLSFGLFFSSECDNLNVKMPGLWPKGTAIYKWSPGRDVGTNRQSQGRVSARGQRYGRRPFGRDNSYYSPERQRLRDQYA